MPVYSKDTPSDLWVFKKYGDKAVKRFNDLAEKVAAHIAIMDGGDKCEYLEIGQGSNRSVAFLFADFSDGVRFWFRSDAEQLRPHICRQDGPDAACPWAS